jgi:nucleoside-triphosphatase
MQPFASPAGTQPFASHTGTDWVLVTGQPGCGKTTAVKKLVEELQASGESVRGFYTDEVLSGGQRVGFDIVTVPDGRRGPLARKGAAGPKVGAYGVDLDGFERLALPTLDVDDDDDTIYVLDEIGRMELKSDAFATRVQELLARGVRLVGAITAPIYGHRVAFCDRVGTTRGVAVHKLTSKTRDGVTAELRESLVTRFVAPPKSSGKRKRK